MMDHDLQNVSDADYRRLIAEAYPSPKRDIHAAVMAQVTAEASQSRKKAKILTPAFRNRFVKYGSIAACFALLVTLGFRVLPMMTKDAVMESENAMAAADMAYYADEAAPEAPQTKETVPETQTAAGGTKKGSPVLYKAVLTEDTALPAEEAEEMEEEIAEEPTAVMAYSMALTDTIPEKVIEEGAEKAVEEAVPAAEAPMVMMAPAPAAEEAVVEEAPVEECVVEEAVLEDTASESAVSPVPLFEAELKRILTEEVAAEVYTVWMTGHGYISPEDWSIAEFVTDLDISRERFTELYDTLTASFAQTNPEAEIVTYDLDLLYP